MSEYEKQVIVEAGVPTIVDERQETAGPSARTEVRSRDGSNGQDSIVAGAPPSSPAVGDRAGNQDGADALETGNSKLETAKSGKPAELCHHVMESGLYCQSPALGDRRFCYSHLRLRGQRLRIARALAQRQSLKVVLPPLDDMDSVLAGLGQVGDALAAGLLPPRQADLLLYTLRQAAAALRWIARSQVGPCRPMIATVPPPEADKVGAPPDRNPQATGEPGLSEVVGDRACPGPALRDEGVGINQKRLVEEYPGFEAEFGLPAGLDLSQPPHLLFPPSAQAWPSSTGGAATAQAVVCNDPPPSKPSWTKESIELEQLEKRREHMSEKSFKEEACRIHAHIEKQAKTDSRKEREAEWQAEADCRNALEEKKAQMYREMDEGQRRAYHVGVLSGIETGRRDAEEEARNRRPPKAATDSQRIVGMERLDSR